MVVLIYLLIAAIIAALSARALFMLYLKARWEEVCVLYILQTGEPANKITEYIETWPNWLIVGYFWVWDFRPFIVHQDSLKKILDYFAAKE